MKLKKVNADKLRQVLTKVAIAVLLVMAGYLASQVSVAAQKRVAVDTAVESIRDEVRDTQEDLWWLKSEMDILHNNAYHVQESLDEVLTELQEIRREIDGLQQDRAWMIELLDELRERQDEWAETYAKAIFEATAYTLDCGNGDGVTSIGAIPEVGRTIAVDPGVIPYGSRVWINGEGPYIAEDTGGAIRGERIDIYVGEGAEAYRTAMRWGRRDVEVVYERGEG